MRLVFDDQRERVQEDVVASHAVFLGIQLGPAVVSYKSQLI
jgi:hypothetical protein